MAVKTVNIGALIVSAPEELRNYIVELETENQKLQNRNSLIKETLQNMKSVFSPKNCFYSNEVVNYDL